MEGIQEMSGLQLQVKRSDYSHIILTEKEREHALYMAIDRVRRDLKPEEIEEVLRNERMRKDGRLKMQDHFRKVDDRGNRVWCVSDIVRIFSVKIEKTNPGWIWTDEHVEIFFQFVLWLMNDDSFSGNLNKGFSISGSLGCGKTSIISAFSMNPIRNIKIITCRDISYDYASSGWRFVKDFVARHQNDLICFDDLGAEAERKFFGDTGNVMAEILLARYDQGNFRNNIITTNMGGKDVSEFYGERVMSRIQEMFNFQKFLNATDYRKHNAGK